MNPRIATTLAALFTLAGCDNDNYLLVTLHAGSALSATSIDVTVTNAGAIAHSTVERTTPITFPPDQTFTFQLGKERSGPVTVEVIPRGPSGVKLADVTATTTIVKNGVTDLTISLTPDQGDMTVAADMGATADSGPPTDLAPLPTPPAITFGHESLYDIGKDSFALTIGDFNHDGHPDVATSLINTSSSISVALNDGKGGFLMPTTYPYGGGDCALTTFDLNGDGMLDLVAGDTDINVLLGNGDGTFQSAKTYTLANGQNMYALTSGLINADDIPDLVAIDDSCDVQIFAGTAKGDLEAPTTTALAALLPQQKFGCQSISVGDLNRDGKADVAVGAVVTMGNGDGTFKQPTIVNTGVETWSTNLADANGDGKLDLFAANAGAVSVTLGNGDGTFQTAKVFKSEAYVLFLAVGDLNGDGYPDVASGGLVGAGVGDGTLAYEPLYTESIAPWHIALADVDGDGQLDLIGTEEGGSSLSVLLNTSR